MKYPSVFGISRIDIRAKDGKGATHGWEIKFRRKGKAYHEHFSDSKFGGWKAALKAAIKRRDKVIAEYPVYTRRENASRLTVRNTSGIPGVYRRIKPVRRGKKQWDYEVWTATGSPKPYERKVKDFYVSVYGEVLAKKLAVEQRHQWEDEMDRYETRRAS